MVLPIFGQALFFAIATAMGIWMSTCVGERGFQAAQCMPNMRPSPPVASVPYHCGSRRPGLLTVSPSGVATILQPSVRSWARMHEQPQQQQAAAMVTKTGTKKNISFHYVTKGCDEDRQRPVLLMLHGFLDFWFIWNRLIPELSNEFCVVAPDLRGYGNTTRPNDTAEYLMRHLIEDVKGLVQHFNPDQKRKVVLVGHDWGGMISFCFATIYEELVHKMIIINGMHPRAFMKQLFRSVRQMRMSWYQLPFRRPVVPEQYLIMKDLAFFDKVHKGFTKDEEYAHKYVYSQPGALTGTINYYRAFNNESSQLSNIPYRKINVSTLILWGEKDEFIMTRVALYNQEWLKNSAVIYYEGAGHFPLRECPTHIISRIRKFVINGTVSVADDRRRWQWWRRTNDLCRESRRPRGTWIRRIPPFIPDNAKLPKEMAE
ncbi:AB hydrolase superfamily protein YfhM-like isoform X2 [Dermacentor albipictus]|uniref:AB hydrolase superfamily protein YfhM-like isoform X2 n=1 Tax=Dermacentor albipictus TaxID=60249 RepID=UPI0038FC5F1C